MFNLKFIPIMKSNIIKSLLFTTILSTSFISNSTLAEGNVPALPDAALEGDLKDLPDLQISSPAQPEEKKEEKKEEKSTSSKSENIVGPKKEDAVGPDAQSSEVPQLPSLDGLPETNQNFDEALTGAASNDAPDKIPELPNYAEKKQAEKKLASQKNRELSKNERDKEVDSLLDEVVGEAKPKGKASKSKKPSGDESVIADIDLDTDLGGASSGAAYSSSKGRVAYTPTTISEDRLNSQLVSAAYSGNADAVSALIHSGRNVNAANKFGETPLMAAVFSGKYNVAKILIDENADVNLTDAKGFTPLHLAVYKGDIAIATELLRAKANPNAKNNRGETPLMFAVLNNNFQMADTLVKSGANVNVSNSSGVSPLQIAANSNNAQMVDYLVKAGANRSVLAAKAAPARPQPAQQLAAIAPQARAQNIPASTLQINPVSSATKLAPAAPQPASYKNTNSFDKSQGKLSLSEALQAQNNNQNFAAPQPAPMPVQAAPVAQVVEASTPSAPQINYAPQAAPAPQIQPQQRQVQQYGNITITPLNYAPVDSAIAAQIEVPQQKYVEAPQPQQQAPQTISAEIANPSSNYAAPQAPVIQEVAASSNGKAAPASLRYQFTATQNKNLTNDQLIMIYENADMFQPDFVQNTLLNTGVAVAPIANNNQLAKPNQLELPLAKNVVSKKTASPKNAEVKSAKPQNNIAKAKPKSMSEGYPKLANNVGDFGSNGEQQLPSQPQPVDAPRPTPVAITRVEEEQIDTSKVQNFAAAAPQNTAAASEKMTLSSVLSSQNKAEKLAKETAIPSIETASVNNVPMTEEISKIEQPVATTNVSNLTVKPLAKTNELIISPAEATKSIEKIKAPQSAAWYGVKPEVKAATAPAVQAPATTQQYVETIAASQPKTNAKALPKSLAYASTKVATSSTTAQAAPAVAQQAAAPQNAEPASAKQQVLAYANFSESDKKKWDEKLTQWAKADAIKESLSDNDKQLWARQERILRAIYRDDFESKHAEVLQNLSGATNAEAHHNAEPHAEAHAESSNGLESTSGALVIPTNPYALEVTGTKH
jgi:hypothetical protein